MQVPWLLAALLAGLRTAGAAPVSLTVFAQESIPPKWIAGADGASGFCPDLLAAIEKLEPRIQFVGYHKQPRSVPYIEQALATGNADVACALLDTPRRQQIARIVGKPVYMVRHRLAARADDPAEIRGYEDLIRLAPLINTSRGAGYTGQLRAMGLPVDESSGDNTVNLRKIVAGHGRFTYMNELTLAWIIHAEHLEDKVRILPVVLREEPMYFWASRKLAPSELAMLTQALDRLHASGEMARIYERWITAR